MGLRSGQVAQLSLDAFRSKTNYGFANNMVAIQRRPCGYSCLVSRRLRKVTGSRIQRADHGRAGSCCRRDRETALRHRCANRLTVAPLGVIVEDLEKVGDNRVALECYEQLAVHVDRRFWLLESSRERDSDICVLRFTGSIDHATHHCNPQVRYSWISRSPFGHLIAKVSLDILCHFLEESRSSTSTAGTCGHLRVKAPKI